MSKNGRFVIRYSREIFSTEEIAILERYGRELERLANGKRVPETAAQQRFVEAVHGRREPETIYESTWAKYAWRLEWERRPETGPPWRNAARCRMTGRTGSECEERSGET